MFLARSDTDRIWNSKSTNRNRVKVSFPPSHLVALPRSSTLYQRLLYFSRDFFSYASKYISTTDKAWYIRFCTLLFFFTGYLGNHSLLAFKQIPHSFWGLHTIPRDARTIIDSTSSLLMGIYVVSKLSLLQTMLHLTTVCDCVWRINSWKWNFWVHLSFWQVLSFALRDVLPIYSPN